MKIMNKRPDRPKYWIDGDYIDFEFYYSEMLNQQLRIGETRENAEAEAWIFASRGVKNYPSPFK